MVWPGHYQYARNACCPLFIENTSVVSLLPQTTLPLTTLFFSYVLILVKAKAETVVRKGAGATGAAGAAAPVALLVRGQRGGSKVPFQKNWFPIFS